MSAAGDNDLGSRVRGNDGWTVGHCRPRA